jgi:hypothetical protein
LKTVAAASLAAILHPPIQRLLSKGMGIIFASGLRNTISFEWKRQTSELWGLDHGIALLGDESNPNSSTSLTGEAIRLAACLRQGRSLPAVDDGGDLTKEQ